MILARGAEQVKAVERALGGTPARASLTKAQAALHRYVAERAKERQSLQADMKKLADPQRELFFSHIPKDDPKLRRCIRDAKTSYERRAKRTLKAPMTVKPSEPEFHVGSGYWVKFPPYDDAQSDHSSSAAAEADKLAGTYSGAAQSFGDGDKWAWGGVAIWFLATEDNQSQRFAAELDWSDDWWDSASGYVAHNDMRTRLWVWGDTEQGWVQKTNVKPEWSDGVGWFDHHGEPDEGRWSVETTFPVSAQRWYLGFVWSEASIYADGGFWGFAASSSKFSAAVRLVVFGSG
jgi:hypothetical protein